MSAAKRLEWLSELWKNYNGYFVHKENLCHAIILVEVAVFASLIISPIPDWYKLGLSRNSGWLKSALPYLPLLLSLMLVSFLFVAHRLLLMQLRMRRGADALADAIARALTRWSIETPKAKDLAPIPGGRLDKYFDGMRATNWFNRNIFPTRAEMPRFNSEDLLRYFPKLVIENTASLYRNSHARPFEKSIASVSLALCLGGSLVLGFRLADFLTNP